MKKIILAAASLIALSSAAHADEFVNGYTRADGTYVGAYYRTAPDATINNNYSTQGNVNPYTGQAGTVAPNPYQPQYIAPQPQVYAPTGGGVSSYRR